MKKRAKQNLAQRTIQINKPLKKTTAAPTGISYLMKLHLFLGVLSFVVYANTLKNGYAGDDELFITNHSLVNKGLKGIPELLTSSRMNGIQIENNDTYRPISLVMFAVEKELFGFNPATGHLINILLFSACVILLLLFLDRLMDCKKTPVAFVAALLFAVHPVHTEVVANIKSRDELLCFFFAFLSLNLFISYFSTGKNNRLIIGLIAFLLSLLSKETSLSFIIVIPLIFFAYLTGDKKRSITITAVSVIAIAVFLGIRVLILGIPSANNALSASADNQLASVPAGASGLATAIYACGYYVKLLFIPYPLLFTYSFSTIPFVSFSDIGVWSSLLAYLCLVIIGIYRLIKFKKDFWAFGILFFLITIALFSNVLFHLPALLAERFLFFASVGFCLLIALFIEKWFFGIQKPGNTTKDISILLKTRVLFLLVIVTCVWGYMTMSRNKDWENDYILNKTDIEKAPNNMRLHYNIGVVLTNNLNNEDLNRDTKIRIVEEGIKSFQKAIAIYPGFADAHSGLAQLYNIKKMFDSAELHAKTALILDSSNVIGLDVLGNIYFNANKFSEAISVFEQEMKINRGLRGKYQNIGTCYLRMLKYDSAVANFKRELSTAPDNPIILYDALAQSFREMGYIDSAKRYEQLIKELERAD